MTLPMKQILTLMRRPKLLLLLLLASLALVGLAGSADWQPKVAILATSLAAALLAEWAFYGAAPFGAVQSAAITGSIIGLLISPGSSLLLVWSASVAAIASKKLLAFREGKHIFNPAAFGLVFSVLVFGNHLNWWGNSSVLVVVIGVGLLLFRLGRLSLPISYFITRTVMVAWLGGPGTFAGAFLLPNLFFAFIMLVEPKTVPGKRTEQWIFGGLGGILATLFYRWLPAFEGDLFALLIVNMLRPLMVLPHRSGLQATATQPVNSGSN